MAALEGHIESFEALDSRQFEILIRGLANSLAYGIDRSPFVGSGVEYAQSRPYQDGDSIRSIDWRVTARTGRHHVKEYETPKNVPSYFLIDTSASMAVSSIARSKYQTALYIAGGLALASLDRVSPVGVVGVGGRALRVRPSLSQARVLQWLHELRTFRYDEGTNLGLRLSELSPSLGQRSLVLVLSDLHDLSALPALKRMAQLHDVVVLQIQDPCESGFAGGGFLRAREAETGREFLTRSARRWLDPKGPERELRRAGIDSLVIRTDRPYAHALRQLFRARGTLGRGTR
jgi:uncharacterized protein (DUF58 family)